MGEAPFHHSQRRQAFAKGRRIDILESPPHSRSIDAGDRTTRSIFLPAKLNKMAADHPENANAGNLKAIHDVEKAKVGSSAMDPSMQMSMVSQTLAISSFPQAVQGE